MTRLIDADALKREACVKFYTTPYYMHILDLIDNAPTVLADNYSMGYQDGVKKVLSERPQGEWEEIEILPEVYDIEGVKTWASKMMCSKCGFTTIAIEGKFTQYNGCPSCFADMREADDDSKRT